jgi:hypothetical protein
MSKVKCDICGYTKLNSHKGLVMHQTSNEHCLGIQRERRIAEEQENDRKPSAIAKTINVARRKQHMDVEGEGPPCKKQRLLEEVSMQKTPMMEPPKREGVQNFWEANSEEDIDLVGGTAKQGQPYSNGAHGLDSFDPNNSSEGELEAESETESEDSGSEDGGLPPREGNNQPENRKGEVFAAFQRYASESRMHRDDLNPVKRSSIKLMSSAKRN